MPKTRELSTFERAQIVTMHSTGFSQVGISKKLKFSRCAVQTTIKRYNDGTMRPGILSISSKTISRRLREVGLSARKARKTPLLSGTNKKKRLQWVREVGLSARKARKTPLLSGTNKKKRLQWARRLREVGLSARKARKTPLLSGTNKKKRLQWARKHQSWTEADWANVMWSDESNIEVSFIAILY
ncbi:Transposase [Popillia japonica]|uniref:Transposase n=1 Tax=Popillia japonica TaxID=7064 RepID=A0AAW1K2U0_POPJA